MTLMNECQFLDRVNFETIFLNIMQVKKCLEISTQMTDYISLDRFGIF